MWSLLREDTILDQMEFIWHLLPEDEQKLLKAEGSRCWP